MDRARTGVKNGRECDRLIYSVVVRIHDEVRGLSGSHRSQRRKQRGMHWCRILWNMSDRFGSSTLGSCRRDGWFHGLLFVSFVSFCSRYGSKQRLVAQRFLRTLVKGGQLANPGDTGLHGAWCLFHSSDRLLAKPPAQRLRSTRR